MAKSRTENVAINTGANVAMSLVSQAMTIVLKTVFAMTLVKQYIGINSLFASIMTVLALADLGIANAIAFALYKPLKDNDQQRISALMRFYKLAYRAVACGIVLLGLCAMPLLPRFVHQDISQIKESIYLIFALFIVDSASSYLLSYKSTLLTAAQKRYITSRISIAFSLCRTAVQCVLLLVFKNYLVFLVVGIAESLLRNFVISRAADREYPFMSRYPDAQLEKGEVKNLFKDVYALALYKVNAVVLTSTDNLIITSMFDKGIDAIANLSFYRAIIGIVDNTTHQFYNSLLPSLGNLASDAPVERQYEMFHTVLFISFWVTSFCTTSFYILLDPFIGHIWMDPSFLEPRIVVFALVFDFYINNILRTLNIFRNANGLFVQGKYRPLAMSVLNLALSIALAKPLGIFGVLFATTMSRICTTLWYDPMLLYKNVFMTSVRDFWQRFSLYLGLAAASVAATRFLSDALATGNHYINFFVKAGLCVLIPNAVIILVFHKTPEYREFILRLKTLTGKMLNRIRKRRAHG